MFATHYFCCSELAGRWLFGDKTYDKGLVYLLNNFLNEECYQIAFKLDRENTLEQELRKIITDFSISKVTKK